MGLERRRWLLAQRVNDHMAKLAPGRKAVREDSFQGLSVKSRDSINLKCIDSVWGLTAEPIGGPSMCGNRDSNSIYVCNIILEELGCLTS